MQESQNQISFQFHDHRNSSASVNYIFAQPQLHGFASAADFKELVKNDDSI